MSIDRFPERIDPRRIFTGNGEIRSELPVSRFPRFAEYLSRSEGSIEVVLHFGHDNAQRRMISGTLDARVTMQCQRCLRDTGVDLHCDMALRVVGNDAEAASLPAGMESVVVDSPALELQALVEDELILSLPIVPQHDDEQCNDYLARLHSEEATGGKASENSPFAKLKQLGAELKND